MLVFIPIFITIAVITGCHSSAPIGFRVSKSEFNDSSLNPITKLNQKSSEANNELQDKLQETDCLHNKVNKIENQLKHAHHEVKDNDLLQLQSSINRLQQQQLHLKQEMKQKQTQKHEAEKYHQELQKMQKILKRLRSVTAKDKKSELLCTHPRDFNTLINAIDKLGITISYDSRKGKGSHTVVSVPDIDGEGKKLTITRTTQGRHLGSWMDIVLDIIQQHTHLDVDIYNIDDCVLEAKRDLYAVDNPKLFRNYSKTARMIQTEIVEMHGQIQRIDEVQQDITRYEKELETVYKKIRNNDEVIQTQSKSLQQLNYEYFMIVLEAIQSIPLLQKLKKLMNIAVLKNDDQSRSMLKLYESRIEHLQSLEAMEVIRAKYGFQEYNLEAIQVTYNCVVGKCLIQIERGIINPTIIITSGTGTQVIFTSNEYIKAAKMYYALYNYHLHDQLQNNTGYTAWSIPSNILSLSLAHALDFDLSKLSMESIEILHIIFHGVAADSTMNWVGVSSMRDYIKCDKKMLLKRFRSQKKAIPPLSADEIACWKTIIAELHTIPINETLFERYYNKL